MSDYLETDNAIQKKSKLFAMRCVKLYKYLTHERAEYVLARQMLRSGTSIGANMREAAYAQSKKDFLAKAMIALRETAETQYWLELLFEADYINQTQFDSIHADCEELLKMLTAITKTIKKGEM